jgi:hypothetical protein
MIQGFLTSTGGGDQNGQIFLDLILTDQVLQFFGTQGVVHAVVRLGFGVEGAGCRHGWDYSKLNGIKFQPNEKRHSIPNKKQGQPMRVVPAKALRQSGDPGH